MRPLVSGYIIQIATHPTKQTTAYTAKVQVGVRASIMGRNEMPATKLADQLVAVARPLPRDRTQSGNSSLCIQGTLPRPMANEDT